MSIIDERSVQNHPHVGNCSAATLVGWMVGDELRCPGMQGQVAHAHLAAFAVHP